MSLHILRCHNRALYVGMSVLIFFACIYTLQREDVNQLQFYGSIAAIAVTILWGGYYALLRYEVDDSGVTRYMLTKRHYPWSSISKVDYVSKERNSQISLSLIFTLSDAATPPLRLSSELLKMSAMEELILEMTEKGKIDETRKEEA